MTKIATILTALAFLPLTACTTDGGEAPAGPPAAPEPICSNEGLDRFLGQKATVQLGADMMTASGARTLRWAAPNTAMTMDFRADRLTVGYDEQLIVKFARCG